MNRKRRDHIVSICQALMINPGYRWSTLPVVLTVSRSVRIPVALPSSYSVTDGSIPMDAPDITCLEPTGVHGMVQVFEGLYYKMRNFSLDVARDIKRCPLMTLYDTVSVQVGRVEPIWEGVLQGKRREMWLRALVNEAKYLTCLPKKEYERVYSARYMWA